MIKINYINSDLNDSPEDITIFNIKLSDQFKKAECLQLSCISWLKLDSSRNFYDLEKMLRNLNLDSHIIAIPNKENSEYILNMPNNKNYLGELKYVALYCCKPKEDCLKELLTHHESYEKNLECLKLTGCLVKNNDNIIIDKNTINNQTINDQTINNNENIKNIIEAKIKYNFEYYKPKESINLIIDDLIKKHNEEPKDIICGEINQKKVHALVINNNIVSPIGWIEIENDDYELIDFRSISVKK